MTARKAQPPSRFIDGFEAWTTYQAAGEVLTERVRDAEQRAADAHTGQAAAVAEHEAALIAVAAGEREDSPGPRPTLDPVPDMVAARARQMLQAHRERRRGVVVGLADDVEAAARDWWTKQTPAAAEHLGALREHGEHLADALDQVRSVRRDVDGANAADHGPPAHGALADRTTIVDGLDDLAAVVDRDPFEVAPPILRYGRIHKDTGPLGLRQFDSPGPSGREPGPAAVARSNPGRDSL